MKEFIKINFKHLIPFLYFFFGSVIITFPLIFNLDRMVPGAGDELYITWIINWNIHAISHNIFQLFNGNIYFPYLNTLSYSDLHLASSLIALVPVLLTGEPLLGYTLNLVLALCLVGFSIYLLVYFLTKDYYSGLISGATFSFSTFLIPKFGQLQVTTIYWIPLSILSYLVFLRFKKFRYFLLTLFFFYLQFINSFMPAYFLLFVLIGISVFEIISKNKKLSFLINKKSVASLFFLILFCIPIIYPYYYTSFTEHYVRNIRESIHNANRPEFFFFNFGGSFLGPYINSVLYKNPGQILYDGYRGIFTIILTFLSLGYFISRKKRPSYFSFFTIVGICTYILSLGPALQFNGHVVKIPFPIPLPYAFFYYFAPGFQGFRNSGRFEVYEIMAFSIAAGILFSFLLRKKIFLKRLFTLIICVGILLEFNFPFKFVLLPNKESLPPIYRYLASQPKNTVIAEFPIYNWNMFPYSFEENKRLYYSSFHFAKTLNGGGGFSPYKWQEEVTSLAANFPSDKALNTLRFIGINHIVVHYDEFDVLYKNKFMVQGSRIPNAKMVKNTLDNSEKIVLEKSFGNASYYKIKK